MLINSKKVKELLKSKGVRCSGDVLGAINEELKKICLKTSDNVLAKKVKTAKAEHVPKVAPLLSPSSQIES